MEPGEVNRADKFLRLRTRPVPRFTAGVSMGSVLPDLDISSGDLSQEELPDILDGCRRKKKYIRRKNGGFLRTDDGEDRVKALADMMDAPRITPGESVKGKTRFPACRALYLDRMLEENTGTLSGNYHLRGISPKDIPAGTAGQIPGDLPAVHVGWYALR